jgi:peptidoglycan/LPS O-acetylase OafA/YrhL
MQYVIYNIGRMDILGQIWLAFTSLFILGQETTLFLEIRDGALGFTPSGPSGDFPVWFFLPVPQAWSISLELMFYALVPFLIRYSTRVLWGIVIATLVLRVAIYAAGYYADPWITRFFPNELGLFVAGMCARRLYDAYAHRVPRNTLLVLGVSFIVITCFVRYLMMHFLVQHVIWPYYALAVVAVPCLFALTRQSKRDQFVGSFSYPLYLIHWAVLSFYDAFEPSWGLPAAGTPLRVLILVLVSFALSWIIVASVEVPLDRYRQRRVAAMA